MSSERALRASGARARFPKCEARVPSGSSSAQRGYGAGVHPSHRPPRSGVTTASTTIATGRLTRVVRAGAISQISRHLPTRRPSPQARPWSFVGRRCLAPRARFCSASATSPRRRLLSLTLRLPETHTPRPSRRPPSFRATNTDGAFESRSSEHRTTSTPPSFERSRCGDNRGLCVGVDRVNTTVQKSASWWWCREGAPRTFGQ